MSTFIGNSWDILHYNSVFTQYADNNQDYNSVIELMFFQANTLSFDNYHIMLELYILSDHASLVVTIAIEKKHSQIKKQIITRNSNKKAKFFNELKDKLGSMNTLYIPNLVCMRDRCGKMAADSELTKQLCHMTLLFTFS